MCTVRLHIQIHAAKTQFPIVRDALQTSEPTNLDSPFTAQITKIFFVISGLVIETQGRI